MKHIDNLYCLILAGGKGRRLWPESRVEMPKQFIDFFGTGRTQLQQTYDRFRKFIPSDHILISTSIQYRDIVKAQLPEIRDAHILAEPIWRNTCPSVAWGAHRVNIFNKDSVIIVAPADQHIIGLDEFEDGIKKGYEFTKDRDTILVMGVTPTRPEPGYGYIQMDDETGTDIHHVKSFTEKPERNFAQMFMESGEFLWNTGIFMANTNYLLNCFRTILPAVLRTLNAASKDFSIEDENRFVAEHFPSYPNISLEQGLLEKASSIDVQHCKFGWADLGTWHSMYEAVQKTSDSNVILDSDVIIDNSHNNIIKVPKGHTAVINGLDGYIVVEKDNILLICPKEDSSALIRKYSAEMEIR